MEAYADPYPGFDEDDFEPEYAALIAYDRARARAARRARPPQPRNDTSGKWQYFRLVCSPNAARGGAWEWTAEEVAARASVELGRDVPLHAVGSTLTKLQTTDGVLQQRYDGTLPCAGSHKKTRSRRLYLPTERGRALAAQMGLPRPDLPGPPSEHGRLPAELVLRVLAALPPTERARAACVCRAWRGLCAAPALWADVRCDGLTRAQALAAVARAGASLRVLHAGAGVLRAADLARLLCGGAYPALEQLTTDTDTSDRRYGGATDFDVATGRAILAACPALRTLACRLGKSADDDEEETAQGDAALRQLCDFLRHPAVRCQSLLPTGTTTRRRARRQRRSWAPRCARKRRA